MTEKEKIRSNARANILKALAHPTRIFIVEKLNKKPYCVCELTEMIGADTSTVSKHISVLKNAGIVNSNKKGTSVYYSLAADCIIRFLGCIETVIEMNLKNQSEYFSCNE